MRDVAQDLMDRFVGFVRGHASSDRGHPGVGVAFIIAALLVLLLGLRWFTDSGGASGSTDESFALDVGGSGATTTIGPSPEAVAVRVGTAAPHGAEDDPGATIGIPGTGLEVEIPLGPTTTSAPGGGGGTTPTTRLGTTPPPTRSGSTTTNPPTTTSPPTTAPTTSTSPPTTPSSTTAPPTTETAQELSSQSLESASIDELVGELLADLESALF